MTLVQSKVVFWSVQPRMNVALSILDALTNTFDSIDDDEGKLDENELCAEVRIGVTIYIYIYKCIQSSDVDVLLLIIT